MDAQAASPDSRTGGPASLIRADLATLLKLAGPVVLSRLGIMAMGLTDTLVVGRYSAQQLGDLALAWSPTSVVLTVSIGLLSGVQVMTARAIGAGRQHEVGAVLRRGLVYAFWIGVGSSLLLFGLGPLLLRSTGLPPALAKGAIAPLFVFSLSMTPYAISVAGSTWLEALSKPTPATVLMWAANIVNLAIDLALVPGHFGAPALGAVGAACATLGSRTALMVATLAYIAWMPQSRALGVFDKPARDRAAEAEQRWVGFGAGVSNLFEVSAFAAMNFIAGWVGGLTIAAWTIVLNVSSIIFMVPLGLSTATSVMVGSAYGARDRTGVNRAGAIGFAVTALFGLAVSLFVWSGRTWIAGAYTLDPAVVAIAVPAFAVACLYFTPDCLQAVIAMALRARGDVWIPSATHMISYVLVMMPLAWFLALKLHLGLNGSVEAVVAASLLSAGLLGGRFAMLAARPRL